MARKSKKEAVACCGVIAIVTVDERGQMVLPKEVREMVGIRGGEKLAVLIWQGGETACCLSLVKAGDLATKVGEMLGPLAGALSGIQPDTARGRKKGVKS